MALKVCRAGVALTFCTVVLSLRAATGPPEIINRAELQFLYPVGASNFITSDPVRVVIQAPSGSVVTFRNASYDAVLTVSGLEQRLYVQVDRKRHV